MAKRYKSPIENGNLKQVLKNCKQIGEGKNGIVYLLPDGKVIKIAKKLRNCIDEYIILREVSGSDYFPKVYECTGAYMVRDYVGGTNLPKYIKEHGLSKRLSLNLVRMIEEFRKLGFTRLDIRCNHVFVQKHERLKVIDPRGHFIKVVPYPRQLLAGLKKLKVLDSFMAILHKEKPEIYENWLRQAHEVKNKKL